MYISHYATNNFSLLAQCNREIMTDHSDGEYHAMDVSTQVSFSTHNSTELDILDISGNYGQMDLFLYD